MAKKQVAALFVFGDPMFSIHRRQLAELAAHTQLPSMYTNRLHVEAGGLMCYGPSFSDLWRRAATYVGKILRGAAPTEVPNRAANEIRSGHQPQDCQGARLHRATLAARTCR